MRDIVSGGEAQIWTGTRTVSASQNNRIHTLAVCGAFALIATIVFGTLSYHPF
jgi:hypothetical protein